MRTWAPVIGVTVLIWFILSFGLLSGLSVEIVAVIFVGLLVFWVARFSLRLGWDLVVRPLAKRHGMIEPIADDFVLAGWSAERAGRWADALTAYDEALQHRPWDEEAEARRAGLVHRCPDLAVRAEQSEWERLVALNPLEVFDHLGSQASNRKLLLVTTACYRLEDRLPLDDLRQAVMEAMEGYADGLVPEDDVRRLQVEAAIARSTAESSPSTGDPFDLFDDGIAQLMLTHPRLGAEVCLRQTAPAAGREKPVRLLVCALGPLYRVRVPSPSWLSSTVLILAQQMYESRDFSAMPILADALQDTGCDSADILSHCRGPGPHVRGCWVVDLVLGKE